MALNDIFKLRIHCRIHGAEVINVMHFVDDIGVAVDGAQELANDFRTNMAATMLARASTDTFFEYIEVIKIVPYGDAPRLSVWPTTTNGGVSGTTPSATLCEVITISSAQIGRRKRGRIYLAGLAPTAMASGQLTPAQTTRTQSFATQLANRHVGFTHPSQFGLGIWSKLNAGPEPPWPTDAFTRASALTVRTIVRTQRRRQVGVGR